MLQLKGSGADERSPSHLLRKLVSKRGIRSEIRKAGLSVYLERTLCRRPLPHRLYQPLCFARNEAVSFTGVTLVKYDMSKSCSMHRGCRFAWPTPCLFLQLLPGFRANRSCILDYCHPELQPIILSPARLFSPPERCRDLRAEKVMRPALRKTRRSEARRKTRWTV